MYAGYLIFKFSFDVSTFATLYLFFIKKDGTVEIKFTRHVSVAQRPSSVESRINLKLHLNL